MTRYDLTIGDISLTNLPKRRLIYEIVAEAIRRGVSISAINGAVPWKGNLFVSADGRLNEQEFLAAFDGKQLRYYTADQDLFYSNGRTYAFHTQWGSKTLHAIENIIEILPEGDAVEYVPTSAIADEVTYDDYVIRQHENGTIEVEKAGVVVQPAMPTLRELAARLNVSQQNGNGNDFNTRQLGAQLINAIRATK